MNLLEKFIFYLCIQNEILWIRFQILETKILYRKVVFKTWFLYNKILLKLYFAKLRGKITLDTYNRAKFKLKQDYNK